MPISPAGGDCTFPPACRLLTRKQFDLTFQGGRKVVRPSLVVFIHQLPDSEAPSRIGLTIGRKIGKAHVRNHFKRRLRDIFRLHRQFLSPPCDIIVIARTAAATASTATLKAEFLSALERGGVFKRPNEAPKAD